MRHLGLTDSEYYSSQHVEILKTDLFDVWLAGLRDQRARARILVRIDRLITGNPGDIRPVGGGVSELRVDYGPGYRIYLLRDGARIILLVNGGDKSTQHADIARAQRIANEWRRR